MTLAEQTARARWPGCGYEDDTVEIRNPGQIYWRRWNPELYDDDAAELIEEARIGVLWIHENQDWLATWRNAELEFNDTLHKDRRTAICLAYLAWAERSKT